MCFYFVILDNFVSTVINPPSRGGGGTCEEKYGCYKNIQTHLCKLPQQFSNQRCKDISWHRWCLNWLSSRSSCSNCLHDPPMRLIVRRLEPQSAPRAACALRPHPIVPAGPRQSPPTVSEALGTGRPPGQQRPLRRTLSPACAADWTEASWRLRTE